MSIYLDNNATTRMAPEVLEAMLPYLTEDYGNPSSQHAPGDAARRAVGNARRQVAGLLGVKPPEIVFTGSATEANHMAIIGALATCPERCRVVTTQVEHPSSTMLFEALAARGYDVVRLPVDADGLLDPALLDEAADERTALVSVMWVNNETGVVMPVARAAAAAKAAGALFHTDAVQAVGKLPVDVNAVHADLLTLSGHKLHGPKGVGALFVRKGVDLPPLLNGHQERRRRGGTENVPGIVGFGAACVLAADTLPAMAGTVRMLRDRLEERVTAALPGVTVNGHRVPRAPGTSNLCLGVDAEAVLTGLDRAGVWASSGSACSSGGTEPSPVLLAMGRSREQALASARFSLSRYTTTEEVDRAADAIIETVRKRQAVHTPMEIAG